MQGKRGNPAAAPAGSRADVKERERARRGADANKVRFRASGDFRLQAALELGGEMRIRISIVSPVVPGLEMNSVISGMVIKRERVV